MEDNIISRIDSNASLLSEEDLDKWAVPQLLEHYRLRINTLATKVYGRDMAGVAHAAFFASAKNTIKNALSTFLFTKQHWKIGRGINSYLLLSLKRLANQSYWEQSSAKRHNVLICPACKEFGDKVLLWPEDRFYRCKKCTCEVDRLSDDLKKSENENNLLLKDRLKFHKLFSLHSRRGFRCPDCKRFIPECLTKDNELSCPYSKCFFFGPISDLLEMAHPVTLTQRNNVISLDIPVGGGGKYDQGSRSLGDLIAANNITPDAKISITQSFEREYKILVNVIDQQIAMVKRMNSKSTYMQKLLMYEAFKQMTSKFPEEMVSYLVHVKQSSDFPIQSRIFQEYLSCIEGALPFTIEKGGKTIDIFSINDPTLNIFDGKSTFDAVVGNNNIIPNNTSETYTGSREFKTYGICFIGKLLDVIDKKTGQSLLKHVKRYSFVDIHIDEKVPLDTEVTVTHYRIPSHYEMKSMVYLQRIREHLVDKIQKRLPGSVK